LVPQLLQLPFGACLIEILLLFNRLEQLLHLLQRGVGALSGGNRRWR
jgi:hypothetical protein